MALTTFDLIIERTGLEDELDEMRLVPLLLPLLEAMDATRQTSPDRARHAAVVAHLLGALRNDAQGRQAFEVPYLSFEGDGVTERTLELRLVYDYHRPDGRVVLRLSNEALNLFLNALDLDVEDAQAATEAIVQSQIARGRFEEAVETARQARQQSVRFAEKIRVVLHQTSRDVRQVDWRVDVPRLLDGARDHLTARLMVERSISESANRRLENLPDGDDDEHASARGQVTEVVAAIDDCVLRHGRLHHELMGARDLFLDEQDRQGFVATAPAHRPDLLGGVLEPLLKMGRAEAGTVVDALAPALFGTRPPETFDYGELLAWHLRPRRETLTAEVPVAEPELVAVRVEPLRYPTPVRAQAAAFLAAAGGGTLSGALIRAEEAGEEPEVLESIALLAFQAFAPDAREGAATPPWRTERTGSPLEAAGFRGDDLRLEEAGTP